MNTPVINPLQYRCISCGSGDCPSQLIGRPNSRRPGTWIWGVAIQCKHYNAENYASVDLTIESTDTFY